MAEGTLFQFLSLIRVKLQDLEGGARLGSHGEAVDKANCQEEEEYPHGGVKRASLVVISACCEGETSNLMVDVVRPSFENRRRIGIRHSWILERRHQN